MSRSEPDLFIGASERTRGGSLSQYHLQLVADHLLGGGFVLLPSDTAYSIAALAVSGSVRTDINKLLRRYSEPISLAFPAMPAVREWIAPNPTVELLLRHFCPGAITVVCQANANKPVQFFNEAGVNSGNGTIGVRIPDSVVERDVAASAGFPVTTVAVRDLATTDTVTSFEQAVEIVESGMRAIIDRPWCAIEGDSFYASHSTVVLVGQGGEVDVKRKGDISFEKIRSCLATPAAVPPANG